MECKESMEKKVNKIIKTKENTVRNAAENKQNSTIFGFKEKVIPMRIKLGKKETKCIMEILKKN